MKSLHYLLGAAALCCAAVAQAQTKWDMPVSWPDNNFHTRNAVKFADTVRERTDGRVDITVHSGGALGLKGPESLRAVRDGIVPIAEMNLSQQSGDMPLLSLETMPFLVRTPAELKTLYSISRGTIETALENANQKLIYVVPWPSQMIFTQKPIAKLDDLKGLRIRTTDRNNSDMMQRFGMSPLAMPYSDLIPALATGNVQAVQTSAPTAVDFKFWEFMKNGLHTNHTWSSNMVTVNLDSWNKLSAADQKLILDIGKELEPSFWQASLDADTEAQKTVKSHGVTITEPTPELLAQMETATRSLWDAFIEKVPAAKEPLNKYLKAIGRQ